MIPTVLLLLAGVPAAAGPPTFYKDVLPILSERCQSCHRAGQAAPMALVTFKDTRPWAKAIKESVLARRMPPWHADSTVVKYRNDLSLSEAERETLTGWVDGGSAEGNAADAPRLKTYVEGWRIARPDAVFSLPETIAVPASGTIDYQYLAVATGFTEDKWVEMAEVRPTSRGVVHHAIVSVRAPADAGWYGGQFLAGYAPGAAPQVWMPGQARLIPAGSYLVFQMHYTSNGKAAEDRTQIGLVFAKQAPRERVYAMRASNSWFTIPPGAPDHRVEAATSVHQPVRLAAIRPHMHLRGKAFQVVAIFPDGTSKMVLRVPRYDFHWQPYYYLETPLSLPAGTRLECTAWFDNSPNNPRNPNPLDSVRWGEQSWDEMMIGWFEVLAPWAPEKPVSSATLRQSR